MINNNNKIRLKINTCCMPIADDVVVDGGVMIESYTERGPL